MSSERWTVSVGLSPHRSIVFSLPLRASYPPAAILALLSSPEVCPLSSVYRLCCANCKAVLWGGWLLCYQVALHTILHMQGNRGLRLRNRGLRMPPVAP